MASPGSGGPSAHSARDLFNRAWTFLGASRRRVGWVIILTIVAALADGISIGLLIPLVQSIGEVDQSAALQRLGPAGDLINWIVAPFEGSFAAIVALMIGVVIGRVGLAYWAKQLTNRIQWRFVHNLRVRLYEQLLRVGYSFVAGQKSGELLYALETQCVRAGYALAHALNIVVVVGTISVFCLLLVLISVPLTLLAVCFGGAIALSTHAAVARARQAAAESVGTDTEMNVAAHEGLGAMRLVRTYGREEDELGRFENRVDASRRVYLRKFFYKDMPGPLSEAVAMGGLGLTLLLGMHLFRHDLATAIPLLITFLAILFRLLPQVKQLNTLRATLVSELPHLQRVLGLLRADNKPFVRSGTRAFPGLRSEIRLDEVMFAYEGRSEYALRGVNLVITRGKVTALVGASGSGKSTLADLIIRLYDPQHGRIVVDGVDLRDLSLDDWRAKIGVVSQDPFMFNASVRENIAYGSRTATDADILEAARRAHAHEFICKLPQGYDTVLGERGSFLSGGQRQRVSIARAILRDPDLLILDEATSALDNASERVVQQAIDELSADRTVLVIAHRLSTIERADCVYVLANGEVVESGTHTDLLFRGGQYAELYAGP